MKKKTFFLSAMMLMMCTLSAVAQDDTKTSRWAVGISGGWDYNSPTIDKGYATDVTYTGKGGWNVGAIGRYQVLDWLAVRADLRVSTRNYQMDRHYEVVSDIYTYHRDTYMHLPVMGDFSIGNKKFRGHLYLGGYIGYWLNAHRCGNAIQQSTEASVFGTVCPFDESMDFDSNRDNRFNAGLLGGLGFSYFITPKWEVMAECFYMYDLTKSNKTNEIVVNPRYNSTTDVNVGVMYNF